MILVGAPPSPPPLATLNVSHTTTVSNKTKQTNRKKGGWNRQPSVNRLSVCAVTGPGANTLRMPWSQDLQSRLCASAAGGNGRLTGGAHQLKRSSTQVRTKEKRRRQIAPLIFSSFLRFQAKCVAQNVMFEIRPQEINSHSAHTINEKFI